MRNLKSPFPAWLNAFPQLAEIHDDEWINAAQRAEILNIDAGHTVFRPGDVSDHFVLVIRGSLRVFQSAVNGREITLYRVQAGEICILTFANLLGHARYSAGAVTESLVQVVRVPRRDFEVALCASLRLREYLFGLVAHRLTQLMGRLQETSFVRLDVRMAKFLLAANAKDGGRPVAITHAELAAELGSTREVITRLLKQFERRGWIYNKRGHIEIRDFDTLTNIAEGRTQTFIDP